MSEENIKRVPFNHVFRLSINGDLVLRVRLMIGGEIFEPETVVRQGEPLGGIDFHKRIGLDLAIVVLESGTYVLRGFFVET